MLDALVWVVVFVNIAVAILVVSKNRKLAPNRYFAAFVVFLNLWMIANFFENEADFLGGILLEFFLRMDFVFAICIVCAWFLFCDSFCGAGRPHLSSRLKGAVVLSTILIGLIAYATEAIVGDVWFEGEVIHFVNGFFLPVYGIYIVYLAGGGLFLLVRERASTRRLRLFRRAGQVDLMLIGFFISIGTAIFINLFLQPVYGVSLEISRIGLYGMSALAIFTGYAIVRHRLFDIKIIIQRGVIFLIFLAVFTAIYFSLASLFGYLFHRVTNATIFASAGITAIIGIFGFGPGERFFRKTTDRFFFKDAYDYAAVLRELSEALGNTIEPKKLFETVSAMLIRFLRVDSVRFIGFSYLVPGGSFGSVIRGLEPHLLESVMSLVRKPILYEELNGVTREGAPFSTRQVAVLELLEKTNEGDEIGILVPVSLKKKALGIMILGKKKSGDPYRDEDIELLRTLAHQVAIAISKAELYGKVKEYSKELEKRVLERTNEIRELQEEQRQIMIDLSHGLQTPLTVAKGELEFLKKTIPGNKKLEAFERSVDEVSKFVYDLLRFSSLEAHASFRSDEVRLSELLDEVIEYFRIIAEEQDVKVVVDVEPGIVVKGDKRRLEEMITALVGNAVKYMKSGKGRKIEIKLSRRKRVAEFSVSDTGVGISNEDLKKIFTRFYRARQGSTNGVKGVGLGLAIAKRIAERHHGTIHAESAVGKGSVFTVKIPCFLKSRENNKN
ncbi:MAG: ATP-binding protein [Patescibacteria group bacterium]